jgi:hypothetical protein
VAARALAAAARALAAAARVAARAGLGWLVGPKAEGTRIGAMAAQSLAAAAQSLAAAAQAVAAVAAVADFG